MEAKFVLSPPGNGIDCHRTWESIYLGAVPVVLSGFLSEELAESLPVLVVDSYKEFLQYSDSMLEALFEEISVVRAEKAFMPFWVNEIWRASNER